MQTEYKNEFKLSVLYKKFKPFFVKYIKPYLRYYIQIFSALIISNFVYLLIPFLTKIIIDDAFIGKDFKFLIILISIITIVRIVMEVGRSIVAYFYYFLVEQINFKVLTDVFNHVLRLPFTFFDNKRTGEILKRVTDANQIEGIMEIFLFQYLNNITIIVINFFACVFINPYVSIIVLFYIIFFFRYNTVVGKVANEFQSKKWDQEKVINSEKNESVVGIRTIKAFSLEIKVFRKIQWLTLKLRKFKLDYQRKFTSLGWIFTIVFSIENFLIFLVSGIFIINGKMSIGEYFALQTLTAQIFAPLSTLVKANKDLQGSTVALDRLLETKSYEEEKHKSQKKTVIKKAEISFENVNFEYVKDQKVLEDINFTIKSGQMIALVGMSGVGKSTVANLIAKFYLPTSGHILIDGININDFDVKSLRNNIGFVLQNPYLFHGTIMDNFRLISPGKSDEEIYKACKIACAHEFIMEFNEKYNTTVGEKGVKLSGGQKQRISIAQAILKDPKILILDEATSHLDLETEQKVQNALNILMKNRTSVIIAHRLSTIIKADYIFVFEKGRIIEIGNHEKLMKKNSYYRKLYKQTAKI